MKSISKKRKKSTRKYHDHNYNDNDNENDNFEFGEIPESATFGSNSSEFSNASGELPETLDYYKEEYYVEGSPDNIIP